MKKCGNCMHYEVCEKYVEPNESFPEFKGGCPAFTDKDLFIKIPCKIGTPVFIVNKTMGYIHTGKFKIDDISQFGKRVFLSRKAAEKALKMR